VTGSAIADEAAAIKSAAKARRRIVIRAEPPQCRIAVRLVTTMQWFQWFMK
jgi:hypothetical protein